MRATTIYRRRNGQWQLVAEHWTRIPEIKHSPVAKIDTNLTKKLSQLYEFDASLQGYKSD